MVTQQDISTTLKALFGVNWELSIYQFYCGQEIVPDTNMLSPLRDNDTAPSFRIFKTDEGSFLAFDYGYSKTYNVYTFVHSYDDNRTKTTTEFDITRICSVIDKDMGLGLDADIFDIIVPNHDLALTNRVFVKKDPPEVAIYPNTFGGADKCYWGQYHITEEWLRFFDIHVIYKLKWSYDKGFTWKDIYTYSQRDPAYYYHLPDSRGRSKCKILNPYNDYKWWTNVSRDDMHSIQGFRQADLTQKKVILTSSLKDVIILRMLGYTAYALNSESCIPTAEFITHLRKYHEEVLVFMDNDNAGVVATSKILALDSIFTRGVFVPTGMSFPNGKAVTDPSDYIKYSQGDFKFLNQLINL